MAKQCTPRVLAVEVLQNVDARGAYAGIALDSLLERSGLDRRDRAFATEVVYGTLRNLSLLDWIIEGASTRKLERIDKKTLAVLRSGLYQALFMESVPPEVACNESVSAAKLVGRKSSSGFVNAVLRSSIARWHQGAVQLPDAEKQSADYLSVSFSHPRWLIDRWLRRFGFERTRSLCENNNRPAPLTLRTNTLRISREGLMERISASGVRCHATRIAPEGVVVESGPPLGELDVFAQGLCMAQDEGAMLVSRALSPYPGCTVIDVCSAPGGKTTHIAELMVNQGKVLALDRNEGRLSLVRRNCERLGITIVEPKVADSTGLPEGLYESADRVMADVPCTGLGVIRRKPDIRWRRKPVDIDAMSRIQRAIVTEAGRCVKRGGFLVYSTCSFEPEETGDIVRWFLDKFPEFQLMDPLEVFSGFSKGGVRSLPLKYACSGVVFPESGRELSGRTEEKGSKCLILLPDEHATDGFFIALLRRR